MELLTNNIQTRDTLFQSDFAKSLFLEDDFNVADMKNLIWNSSLNQGKY